MLSRSVALRSLRTGVSLRAYSTTPSLFAVSKKAPAATSTAPSGNSTAPEDISSRPAAPGPSAPHVDPKVAAPDTVSRGEEGANNNWSTSFAGMSERPFDGKAAEVLTEELNANDVEIKPGKSASLGNQ